MTRALTALALLCSVACNPPTAKDRDNALVEVVVDDSGISIGAFKVVGELGAEARSMAVEMDVQTKGFVTDESTIALTGYVGGSVVGSANDSDVALFTFTPQVEACDAAGYEVTADG